MCFLLGVALLRCCVVALLRCCVVVLLCVVLLCCCVVEPLFMFVDVVDVMTFVNVC